MVQCGAVCCSVVRCGARLQYRVVQCGAEWCSLLQCVAVCCSVLQCVTKCGRVWQCDALTFLQFNTYFFFKKKQEDVARSFSTDWLQLFSVRAIFFKNI